MIPRGGEGLKAALKDGRHRAGDLRGRRQLPRLRPRRRRPRDGAADRGQRQGPAPRRLQRRRDAARRCGRRRGVPALVLADLAEAGVELVGDERARAAAGGIAVGRGERGGLGHRVPRPEAGGRVVDSLEEAIEHVNRNGTRHSEAIVSGDEEAAGRFAAGVDAAVVYINASTRFTDGFEFGMGAEIGNSTQKLHARGPIGLRELTTYKYLVRGDGQVRE